MSRQRSYKQRVEPTLDERRKQIEASMVALLKRTSTTLEHFKFAHELREDIQNVLALHQEVQRREMMS